MALIQNQLGLELDHCRLRKRGWRQPENNLESLSSVSRSLSVLSPQELA
jgi:hypothetical protein